MADPGDPKAPLAKVPPPGEERSQDPLIRFLSPI